MKTNCENCINAEHLYDNKNPHIFCGLYEQAMQKRQTPMCYESKEIIVDSPILVKPIVKQITLSL